MTKLMLDDLVPEKVELSAIEALTVHVPLSINVTSPLEEFTEQIRGVEVAKLFAPPPAETVAVKVGGVAPIAYRDVNELVSIVRVRLVPQVRRGLVVPEASSTDCARQVFIVCKFVDARNGFAPKEVTLVGIVIVDKSVATANACEPIVVTPSGIMIEVSFDD
jgi:hypothetical protein